MRMTKKTMMRMMMETMAKMSRTMVNAYWHPLTYLVMLLLAPRMGGG
jgi:hypothetical protein